MSPRFYSPKKISSFFLGRREDDKANKHLNLLLSAKPINRIRPFTVGRSAYKGFTSDEGVRIVARFYTFVETCKLNGVSPMEYFVKVLEALTNAYRGYEKLTPVRIK